MSRSLRPMLGLCAALSGCSAPASKGQNVTLLVKPSPTVDSCLGVVGFEVRWTSAKSSGSSGALLNSAAVQTLDGCKLETPITIGDIEEDAAVIVTVNGYDGQGTPRVTRTQTVGGLQNDPHPLVLGFASPPPAPPLIVNRQALLSTFPLSDVQSMTIATVGKGPPVNVLDVVIGSENRPYFQVDPGGFGVEGITKNQDLVVEFTFATPGRTLPKKRVTAMLEGPVFVAR